MPMTIQARGFSAFAAGLLLLPTLPTKSTSRSTADPVYDPLWLYNGTWVSTSTPGNKRDVIANDCARVGKYFGCQQTVNGKMSALIIFLPLDQHGHYATQGVDAKGIALGRGDLNIAGEHWIYSSEGRSDRKTTYYRTTNKFTGRDRIHFELSESVNGKSWTVTRAGDEVRQR